MKDKIRMNQTEVYERLKHEHNALRRNYEDLKEAFDRMSAKLMEALSRNTDEYYRGFKDGQNNLQLKANKILDTFEKWDADTLCKLFGAGTNIELLYAIQANFEKIVTWEKDEKRIKVGDVIEWQDERFIVIKTNDVGGIIVCFKKDGTYTLEARDVSKTGKHYPIDEMLKELE